MRSYYDRRQVLVGALGGLAGLSLAPLSLAGPAAAKAATTRLTDKLALISGVGCNVLALSTGQGLLLVDSGSASEATALRKQLATLPGGGRVLTLINTHWHPEQTGSNEAFGKAGAQILAQEKTRLWLSTDHYRPAQDRYEKALPKAAQPVKGFYTREALSAGGESLQLGYLLEAHTDGDCYVQFRDANVIAVGDVVSPELDPILDWYGGGWLGGRIDAIALLLQLGNDATRYVPSQGPVVTRAALSAEHDMLVTVFTRMTELLRKGRSAQDMLEAGVMGGLSRTFKDPRTFVQDAFKGLWAHYNTLSPDIV